MNRRVPLALASLFAGMILLFEGVSPSPSNLFDGGLIFLGLALVTGYLAILGDTFREWMNDSPLKAMTPVISSLGVAVLCQSASGLYSLPSRTVMAVTGFILVLLPPLLLWLRGS